MDVNIIISEINASGESLSKEPANRSHLSSVFCRKVSKALDHITSKSEYNRVITGLWCLVGQFAEYLPYVKPTRAFSELCLKLFRQCAKAVLNIQWQNLEEDISLRQNFLASLASLHSKLVPLNFSRFCLLETLSENPWTHPTLAKIMGGEVDDSTKEEVQCYIGSEDPIILQLRVDMMLKENCEEYALNLCNSYLNHPDLKSDLNIRKTHLFLLYKLGQEDKLQEECQKLSIQDAVHVIKQLQTSRTHRKLCTVLAQTFMVQNWIRPTDMEANKELLRLWIRHQLLVDREQDQFKESVWAMAKLSQSTEQIVVFIDVLREECGETFLQLFVDMCIFAINVDKGQMEINKKEGNREVATARRSDMAFVCAKLSCLCHHTSIKVARICALTSFALKPTEQSFAKIGAFYGQGSDCCDKCGKDKKQEPGTINPATLYEVERLLSMLRPDYLNPDQSYANIYILCRRYLQESLNKIQCISQTSLNPTTAQIVDEQGKCIPPCTTNITNLLFDFHSPQDVQSIQMLLSKMRLMPPKPPLQSPTPSQHLNLLATTKPSNLLQSQQLNSALERFQYMIGTEKAKNDAPIDQQYPRYQTKPEKEQEHKYQVTQIIQAALNQDPITLHRLIQSASPDILQSVLNIIKGTLSKPSDQVIDQQQKPKPQQIKQTFSSSKIEAQPLPTVSTLLKPTFQPHQQLQQQPQEQQTLLQRRRSRPPLHVQPIIISTSKSTTNSKVQTTSVATSENINHITSSLAKMNNGNQLNTGSEVSNNTNETFLRTNAAAAAISAKEKLKAENFLQAKSQAENIRHFLHMQMSNFEQTRITEPRQMSGSIVTMTNSSIDTDSGVTVFNLTSDLQTPPAKLQVQECYQQSNLQKLLQQKLKQKQTLTPQKVQILSTQGQQQLAVSSDRVFIQQPQLNQQQQQQQQNNVFSFESKMHCSLPPSSVLPSADILSGSIVNNNKMHKQPSHKISSSSKLLMHANVTSSFPITTQFSILQKSQDGSLNKVGQPQKIIGISNMAGSLTQPAIKAINKCSAMYVTTCSLDSINSFSRSNLINKSPNVSEKCANFMPDRHIPNFQQFDANTHLTTSAEPKSNTNVSKKDISQEQKSNKNHLQEMKKEVTPGDIYKDTTNNAIYRCILCGISFKTLDHLREHVKRCKPEQQSPNVYNSKFKLTKANSAKAGLETTTVFQCLRCLELCVSNSGIKQHRLVCKRVPLPSSGLKTGSIDSERKETLESSAGSQSLNSESKDNSAAVSLDRESGSISDQYSPNQVVNCYPINSSGKHLEYGVQISNFSKQSSNSDSISNSGELSVRRDVIDNSDKQAVTGETFRKCDKQSVNDETMGSLNREQINISCKQIKNSEADDHSHNTVPEMTLPYLCPSLKSAAEFKSVMSSGSEYNLSSAVIPRINSEPEILTALGSLAAKTVGTSLDEVSCGQNLTSIGTQARSLTVNGKPCLGLTNSKVELQEIREEDSLSRDIPLSCKIAVKGTSGNCLNEYMICSNGQEEAGHFKNAAADAGSNAEALDADSESNIKTAVADVESNAKTLDAGSHINIAHDSSEEFFGPEQGDRIEDILNDLVDIDKKAFLKLDETSFQLGSSERTGEGEASWHLADVMMDAASNHQLNASNVDVDNKVTFEMFSASYLEPNGQYRSIVFNEDYVLPAEQQSLNCVGKSRSHCNFEERGTAKGVSHGENSEPSAGNMVKYSHVKCLTTDGELFKEQAEGVMLDVKSPIKYCELSSENVDREKFNVVSLTRPCDLPGENVERQDSFDGKSAQDKNYKGKDVSAQLKSEGIQVMMTGLDKADICLSTLAEDINQRPEDLEVLSKEQTCTSETGGSKDISEHENNEVVKGKPKTEAPDLKDIVQSEASISCTSVLEKSQSESNSCDFTNNDKVMQFSALNVGSSDFCSSSKENSSNIHSPMVDTFETKALSKHILQNKSNGIKHREKDNLEFDQEIVREVSIFGQIDKVSTSRQVNGEVPTPGQIKGEVPIYRQQVNDEVLSSRQVNGVVPTSAQINSDVPTAELVNNVIPKSRQIKRKTHTSINSENLNNSTVTLNNEILVEELSLGTGSVESVKRSDFKTSSMGEVSGEDPKHRRRSRSQKWPQSVLLPTVVRQGEESRAAKGELTVDAHLCVVITPLQLKPTNATWGGASVDTDPSKVTITSHQDGERLHSNRDDTEDSLNNKPSLRSHTTSLESNKPSLRSHNTSHESRKSFTSKRTSQESPHFVSKRSRKSGSSLSPKNNEMSFNRIIKDSCSSSSSLRSDSKVPLTRSSHIALEAVNKKSLQSREVDSLQSSKSSPPSVSSHTQRNVDSRTIPEALLVLKPIKHVNRSSPLSSNTLKQSPSRNRKQVPARSLRNFNSDNAIAVSRTRRTSVALPTSVKDHAKTSSHSRKSIAGNNKNSSVTFCSSTFLGDRLSNTSATRRTLRSKSISKAKQKKTAIKALPKSTTTSKKNTKRHQKVKSKTQIQPLKRKRKR